MCEVWEKSIGNGCGEEGEVGAGNWFLVAGNWLLVSGFWVLVTGGW